MMLMRMSRQKHVVAGGRDGDAALLLLLHPVHHGGAFVHLADLVGDARIEQDAFGGRGLTGIDVSHDADVPRPTEWCLAWHCEDPSSLTSLASSLLWA
jgi:hypothetical protein